MDAHPIQPLITAAKRPPERLPAPAVVVTSQFLQDSIPGRSGGHAADGIAPQALVGAAAQRTDFHHVGRARDHRLQQHPARTVERAHDDPRLAAVRAHAHLIVAPVEHPLGAHQQLAADVVKHVQNGRLVQRAGRAVLADHLVTRREQQVQIMTRQRHAVVGVADERIHEHHLGRAFRARPVGAPLVRIGYRGREGGPLRRQGDERHRRLLEHRMAVQRVLGVQAQADDVGVLPFADARKNTETR